MMALIQKNNNPPENAGSQYTFIVTCLNTPVCNAGSLAVTDTKPPETRFTPRIRLCPPFFDPKTPETQNNLSSKAIIRDPKRRDNSWCQPGQSFSFFETAGHTIMHEMTQLDQLGSKPQETYLPLYE